MKKTLCKYFKAKSPSFGLVEGGNTPFDLERDSLATCWCVRTQGPMAPDSGFAAPSSCTEGRRCFVAPSG